MTMPTLPLAAASCRAATGAAGQAVVFTAWAWLAPARGAMQRLASGAVATPLPPHSLPLPLGLHSPTSRQGSRCPSGCAGLHELLHVEARREASEYMECTADDPATRDRMNLWQSPQPFAGGVAPNQVWARGNCVLRIQAPGLWLLPASTWNLATPTDRQRQQWATPAMRLAGSGGCGHSCTHLRCLALGTTLIFSGAFNIISGA